MTTKPEDPIPVVGDEDEEDDDFDSEDDEFDDEGYGSGDDEDYSDEDEEGEKVNHTALLKNFYENEQDDEDEDYDEADEAKVTETANEGKVEVVKPNNDGKTVPVTQAVESTGAESGQKRKADDADEQVKAVNADDATEAKKTKTA